MTSQVRITFEEELLKLQSLVLNLAKKVRNNGDILLDCLKKKKSISEFLNQIKLTDKEVDSARWKVHDYGDSLIVLQQPVAKDFRQIITSIQITDNLERIGDHIKKIAKLFEKSESDINNIPDEIIKMAELSLNMLNDSIKAYSEISSGEVNMLAEADDEVDKLEKQSISKVVELIKTASEDKIKSLTKLLFIPHSFERIADHSVKIGYLVNYAITGKRDK